MNHLFLKLIMSNEWDDIVCLPIIDISNNYNKNDVSIEQDSIDFITYQQLHSHVFSIDLGGPVIII